MNSKEVIAYFYNHSKNPDEVITNDRWSLDTAMSGVNSEKLLSTSLWAQYAKGWGVKDAVVLGDFQTPERTNITKIYNLPWETCDALDPSSWGYNKRTTEEEYINTNELIDYLSDIVSKGGNLLINIGPKADGTIPKVMEDRLRGIGEWLSVNGEAIYGTRPWAVYGEGPGLEEAGFSTSNRVQFKAGDVRYTTRGDILYAIMLEWPGSEITLNSLKDMKVINISLIGSDEIIQWRMINDGLNISLPKDPVSPHANTLKISFQGN
jgi:alpha-L-fucosidase